MSLHQQIQREINERAKIERLVEKKKKKVLNQPQNRCFRLIDNKDDADAFLIFNLIDVTIYTIVLNNKNTVEELEKYQDAFIYPLRNTNRRDSKNATKGNITSNLIGVTLTKS